MNVTVESLTETLTPHFRDVAARDVAVSLLNAITATERALMMDASREMATGVARMLTDFAVNLQNNPFWQNFGTRIMPVFAAAVMSRMDSYEHASERQRSDIDSVAHLTSRQMVVELAVYVHYCATGSSAGSVPLRRALLEDIGGLADAR